MKRLLIVSTLMLGFLGTPLQAQFSTDSHADALIPGWEWRPNERFTGGTCTFLEEPFVQQLLPSHRAQAIAKLEHASVVALDDREASAMTGIASTAAFSVAAVQAYFDSQRALLDEGRRKYGSVDVNDQRRLDELGAMLASGELTESRPYLVRAATKIPPEGGGRPFMGAYQCGANLYIGSMVFTYEPIPSEKYPVIVLLAGPPAEVRSAVIVAR